MPRRSIVNDAVGNDVVGQITSIAARRLAAPQSVSITIQFEAHAKAICLATITAHSHEAENKS